MRLAPQGASASDASASQQTEPIAEGRRSTEDDIIRSLVPETDEAALNEGSRKVDQAVDDVAATIGQAEAAQRNVAAEVAH